MKNFIKNLLLVFAAGLILLSSCEKDPDLRKPDTPIQCAAYVSATDNSDFKVDLTDLPGMNIELVVDVMYDDPFQELELVVVRNNDFENQYVVVDNISSVPYDITIGIDEFIAAIPDLDSQADILEGDLYNFFVNVTLEDGTYLPGYTANGSVTYSPSMRNILAGVYNATFNEQLFTPCILDLNDFEGDYLVTEDGGDPYPVTVEVNTEAENSLLIRGLWWDGTTVTTIFVDPDYYTITADNQMIWPGNAYDAYGTIWLEDFAEGFLNTCTLEFSFIATPTLPDTGLWWGVSPIFYFTPAGKANIANKGLPSESSLIKR
jgi:hypothetical protein